MATARTAVLIAGTAVALAAGMTAGVGAPASAKETWQVVVHMPESLWHDGANLFTLAEGKQKLKVGRTARRGIWQNYTFSHPTTKQALKQAGEKDQPQDAALSDRRLNRRESKRLRQRPLWVDADVLLVDPRNPACTSGLSSTAVREILAGSRADWGSLVPAGSWPIGAPTAIRPYVAAWDDFGSPEAQPLFGMRRIGGSTRVVVESSAVAAAASNISAAVAAKYSALRFRPGACAVPVDGVAPTDATVRAGTYPFSATVYWVTKKNRPRSFRVYQAAEKAFAKRLFGSPGRRYLATQQQRDRLRP